MEGPHSELIIFRSCLHLLLSEKMQIKHRKAKFCSLSPQEYCADIEDRCIISDTVYFSSDFPQSLPAFWIWSSLVAEAVFGAVPPSKTSLVLQRKPTEGGPGWFISGSCLPTCLYVGLKHYGRGGLSNGSHAERKETLKERQRPGKCSRQTLKRKCRTHSETEGKCTS